HAAPAESAGQPVPAVPDKPAVAPRLRRVRHPAASRLGVGRALGALRLCHQSSPSFLPAVCAVVVTVSDGPRYRLRASHRSEMEPGRTGHQTLRGVPRANPVYRPYDPCNACATLLSRTVTERAPSLTCHCPRADLAGNRSVDHGSIASIAEH